MSDSEKFITASVINFINQHIQSSHLDSLDEIVLNYVVTVLENLAEESESNVQRLSSGSDPTDSFLEIEEFCEMLSAYFPEFSAIPQSVVSQWIFELVSSLQKSSQKDQTSREATFESLLDDMDREPRPKRCSESSSDSSCNGSKKSSSSRTPRVSETSDSESDVADIIQRLQLCQLELDEKVQTLIEMFPSLSRADSQNFVSLSNGDLERCVTMVLLQIESGNFSHTNHVQTLGSVPVKLPRNGGKGRDVDERVLKDRIVARYGFIDQAEDAKEFRPAPPKDEPKKLVRYREGQVVSTKGERYSEVRYTKDGEEKPFIAKPTKPQN